MLVVLPSLESGSDDSDVVLVSPFAPDPSPDPSDPLSLDALPAPAAVSLPPEAHEPSPLPICPVEPEEPPLHAATSGARTKTTTAAKEAFMFPRYYARETQRSNRIRSAPSTAGIRPVPLRSAGTFGDAIRIRERPRRDATRRLRELAGRPMRLFFVDADALTEPRGD